MTPVDPAALVVGIIIIVGTLVLVAWALYLAWLGPDGSDDEPRD